eukprot:TRINITY_DN1032_c0_g2_i1.p2 TRINITY_DN1032_c0_g2~~TRINITY_DN1032_c0_g2_i1.p2  ORF type:complete len:181 (-),score=30.16 TRINITY_DN1032_c0_g2_i1:42-584(-)
MKHDTSGNANTLLVANTTQTVHSSIEFELKTPEERVFKELRTKKRKLPERVSESTEYAIPTRGCDSEILNRLEERKKKLYAKLEKLREKREKYVEKKANIEAKSEIEKKFTEDLIKRYRNQNKANIADTRNGKPNEALQALNIDSKEMSDKIENAELCKKAATICTVSYTHLTLPTICSV